MPHAPVGGQPSAHHGLAGTPVVWNRHGVSAYNAGVRPTPLCVHCRRHPVDAAWRPFCSERCQLEDLAEWADGTYRVPGEPLSHSDNDDDGSDDVDDRA